MGVLGARLDREMAFGFQSPNPPIRQVRNRKSQTNNSPCGVHIKELSYKIHVPPTGCRKNKRRYSNRQIKNHPRIPRRRPKEGMGRDPRITPNVNRFAVLHQEASCRRDERRNLHNPMPSPRRILLLGRGERPRMVHIFSSSQGDPKNRGGRVELTSQFGYQSLVHMDQRPQTQTSNNLRTTDRLPGFESSYGLFWG